jgi:arabinofuranosyltransferase
MHVRISPKNRIALVVIALAAVAAVYCGWRLFWFLTDDAFIAFRYISNSRLGYGYVWNAPPFRPVEGYTSFLWVVLLDLIWRVGGVEPPKSANFVSLIFSYLTLITGALMVMKMNLRDDLRKHRILLLGIILVGTITNRTFLAWTSSGLETAMFNFFLTLWIYCCVFLPARSRQWIFSTTLTVALVYLTRPDGLLFAMVTLGLVAHTLVVAPDTSTRGRIKLALAASPLLLIPAHLFWRRAFYGEWLPNTYYAKTIAGRIWIESGARYFLSFVIEYSLWVWLILLLVAIVVGVKRLRAWRHLDQAVLVKLVVGVALLAHFLYYTVVIGGDHFEYRVYSHLIPLIFISFLWLVNVLHANLRTTLLLFSLFIALSWPIPWIHWLATHNLTGRDRTVVLRQSVAGATQREFSRTPGFLLAYLRIFDGLQFWLITHSVCMRHQEHKWFYLHLIETLPSRAEGLAMNAADYPVMAAGSVGVLSWVLPRVNIIDGLGLNDFVAARNPYLTLPIEMAHERQPPDGYVRCFSPNVDVDQGHILITRRTIALTADKIVDCERKYAALLKTPEKLIRVAPPVNNPIDEPHFFVRQLYHDVLGREPDQNGLDYWASHLRECPTGSECFNDSRVTLESVFLSGPEFKERGFFVYRANFASFGRAPSFADFIRDQELLAAHSDIDWRDPNDLIPVHRSFLEDWVKRAAFRAAYPETLRPEEFVNRLFDTAELKPFTLERERENASLGVGKSRAEVLEAVVELDEFKRREGIRARVLLQFLLQLRRDVDYRDERIAPWLDKLQRNESVDQRRVLCLFLTSEDYQRRFGTVATHHNSECR